jgi:hypothetical protein
MPERRDSSALLPIQRPARWRHRDDDPHKPPRNAFYSLAAQAPQPPRSLCRETSRTTRSAARRAERSWQLANLSRGGNAMRVARGPQWPQGVPGRRPYRSDATAPFGRDGLCGREHPARTARLGRSVRGVCPPGFQETRGAFRPESDPSRMTRPSRSASRQVGSSSDSPTGSEWRHARSRRALPVLGGRTIWRASSYSYRSWS